MELVMVKNFFLLFRRNLQKNKLFSFLNILGLALGFAGFILSYQYINRETSYDKMLTVTYQSIRAARTNPADNLRDE